MMLLGSEPEHGPERLDVKARLNDLGWVPESEIVAKAVALVDEWLHVPTLKLRAGEMTAQESRTVKAVLTSLRKSIQALDQDHDEREEENPG
jgi:hypothetical protein